MPEAHLHVTLASTRSVVALTFTNGIWTQINVLSLYGSPHYRSCHQSKAILMLRYLER